MSNSLATYGHFMRRIRTVHLGIKYNTMLLYVRVSVVLIFASWIGRGGGGGAHMFVDKGGMWLR